MAGKVVDSQGAPDRRRFVGFQPIQDKREARVLVEGFRAEDVGGVAGRGGAAVAGGFGGGGRGGGAGGVGGMGGGVGELAVRLDGAQEGGDGAGGRDLHGRAARAVQVEEE